MPYVTSPNMNLTIPVVGSEAGPQYAVDVNNSLTLVDQHNHSPGYGVQVIPSGLNINSDLTIQNNNLTNIRSSRYFIQPSPLSSPSDLDCVYVSGVDLYYNDGNGNQIQLTLDGAVNGTPGSISNLVPPANVSYSPSTQTFIFQSAVNTAANLDIASITLRNLTANSFGYTINPPPAMSMDYNVTLPVPPVSSLPLVMDPSGNITASQITQAMLAPGAGSPTGAVIMYGGATAPTGWLLCDGTSYLQSTYPTLYAAIGNAFGSADSTHFNVPDTRGYFVRGVDSGAGRDPETNSRTAMNAGGNSGDNVGSVQTGSIAGHTHTVPVYGGAGGGAVLITADSNAGTPQGSLSTTSQSGDQSETRPINAYFNFIIKI